MTDTAYDDGGANGKGSEVMLPEALTDEAIERQAAARVLADRGVTDARIAEDILDAHSERILIVRTSDDREYVRVANEHGIWRTTPSVFQAWVQNAAAAIVEAAKGKPESAGAVTANTVKNVRNSVKGYFSAAGAEAVRRVLPGVYQRLHRSLEINGLAGRWPAVRTCESTDLDSNRRYMGTPNGVIDLQNISAPLSAADGSAQACLVSKRTAVPLEPAGPDDADAEADVMRVTAHLEPRDLEWLMRSVVWEMRGAAGRVYFLVGDGGRGKSSFLKCVEACLGEYATDVSQDVFLPSRFKSNTDDEMAKAIGARIARTDELPPVVSHKMIERMKTWSGGEGKSARAAFSPDRVEGKLPAVFASVNTLPDFWGDTPGFYGDVRETASIDRRICPLEFPAFEGAPDEGLTDRLTDLPDRQRAMLRRLITLAPLVDSPPPLSEAQRAFIRKARNEAANGAFFWIEKHIRKSEGSRLSGAEVWARALESHGADDPDDDKPTVFGIGKVAMSNLLGKYLKAGIAKQYRHPTLGRVKGWDGWRLATYEEIQEQEANQ